MLARPVVFVVGLLACTAAVVTCATEPADQPHRIPAPSDWMLVGGLVLTVFGVAGSGPRGQQMLGRRPSRKRDDA